MTFLANFIKVLYKSCSFPSVAVVLSLAIIKGFAQAIAGGGIFGYLSFRGPETSVTDTPIKNGFNNFDYAPMSKEESNEIQRQMYLRNKESLRRRREKE